MYQDIINQQNQILKKLHLRKILLSFSRIILLVVAVYLFYLMMYQRNESLGWWAFAALILFIVAVNRYLKLQIRVHYHKTLQKINEDEIAFLEGTKNFENGAEFADLQHQIGRASCRDRGYSVVFELTIKIKIEEVY